MMPSNTLAKPDDAGRAAIMTADEIGWFAPAPPLADALDLIVDHTIREEMLSEALSLLHAAQNKIARLEARIIELHEARRVA